MKTIGHIENAMAILSVRIAREPQETIASVDRELFKLLREARPGIAALIEEHEDGECYCPENLAVKYTCPHCRAKNQNWITEMKETELQDRLRKSIEALAAARNNESKLLQQLKIAKDTKKKAKARFEELFLAEEKAEVARRKQGS